MKDGWHKVYGEDVYIEDGKVLRGTTGHGFTYRTTYPYRWTGDGYTVDTGITVDALRAGMRRGTIAMK